MSHLSELLDRQSWLTTAAADISQTFLAEIEQHDKQLERETSERQKGWQVCGCGIRYDGPSPYCCACLQQPSTQ